MIFSSACKLAGRSALTSVSSARPEAVCPRTPPIGLSTNLTPPPPCPHSISRRNIQAIRALGQTSLTTRHVGPLWADDDPPIYSKLPPNEFHVGLAIPLQGHQHSDMSHTPRLTIPGHHILVPQPLAMAAAQVPTDPPCGPLAGHHPAALLHALPPSSRPAGRLPGQVGLDQRHDPRPVGDEHHHRSAVRSVLRRPLAGRLL